MEDTVTIQQILHDFDSWGVPHFQRGSVWGNENVSALLESLYYDTPCGSIILWRPSRAEDHGVPVVPGGKCTYLVIVGQQRTRSLHAVFSLLSAASTQNEKACDETTTGVAGTGRQWAINLNELP